MNPIVIYQSKYGFTERYAHWIADALSCPCKTRNKLSLQKLASYDTVIYGGGLYAGGVGGIRLLTEHWDAFREKQILVFTCGLANPSDSSNVAHIRKSLTKNFSPEMQRQIALFHLRGGIDYKALSIVHRAMMYLLYRSLKKKQPDMLRSEDQEFLLTYGKAVDFTDQTTIAPILSFFNQLSEESRS